MPRNNQLGLGAPRSPPTSMPFNSYTGQLAVSVQDTAASQWTEGGLHFFTFHKVDIEVTRI